MPTFSGKTILVTVLMSIVLPFVIRRTGTGGFEWIDPYLRSFWTLLFLVLSIMLLFTKGARGLSSGIRANKSKRFIVISYIAIFVLGGAILSGYWWFAGKMTANPQMGNKISLVQRYPLEWPQTDGLTDDTELIPLSGTTLKAIYRDNQDYVLTPFVRNDDEKTPLMEPSIAILLPLNVGFKKGVLWRHNNSRKYRDFHAEGFGSVVNGTIRGINENLILNFPAPGIYPVGYRITGIAGGVTVKVDGNFNLELVKEETPPIRHEDR